MKWVKHGLIYDMDSMNHENIKNLIQVPRAILLSDRIRVFFATRPENNQSMTSFMDVDIQDPKKILYIHPEPVLPLGDPGHFDEHGVMVNEIIKMGEKYYLYYIGWSKRCSIDYSTWMGVAVSDDCCNFTKVYKEPIFDRVPGEPYSATGLFIYKDSMNPLTAWYAKGTDWLWNEQKDKWEHVYRIVQTRSLDGLNWERGGSYLFDVELDNEANTGATVICRNGKYHMWFCYRGSSDFRDGKDAYEIGYASSTDMKTWERNDSLAGITRSTEGWDSTMIAYPYILETPVNTYMFYNGNGFGSSGFGYAILEE